MPDHQPERQDNTVQNKTIHNSQSSPRCPYLGLQADPASVFAEPTEEHRCYVTEHPQEIDLDHQADFCLTSAFEACPRFVPLSDTPAPPVEAPSSEPDPQGPVATEAASRLWFSLELRDYLEENLVELALWVGIALLAIASVLWYLMRPLPGATPATGAPVAAVSTTTPSPSAAASPPATAAAPAAVEPAPVAQSSTPTPAAPPPTLPPGHLQAALSPAGNAVGWVSSGDRTNHFGDRNIHVGAFEGHTYHGAMQFSLASIPDGSKIEQVTLELTGLNAENLAEEGTWSLRLLSAAADEDWPSATYDQIHNGAVLDTLAPELSPEDLGTRQVNVFRFSAAQRAELARRLEADRVSFRIDGPSEGGNNLFTWDTGYGGGFGSRPVLRVTYQPPPTLTPIVVTATSEPANVVTVAALAATATYQATAVGSPTPWPLNVVTATPPLVITNTPVPKNAATASWLAAEATAQAYLYGTPTPLPTNVWTAVPESTNTPVPLLIPWGQIAPTPGGTPTPTPTPTPSELPAVLKGKIAFLSDRLGEKEPAIFVVNPDGGNLAMLTNSWVYQRALQLGVNALSYHSFIPLPY